MKDEKFRKQLLDYTDVIHKHQEEQGYLITNQELNKISKWISENKDPTTKELDDALTEFYDTISGKKDLNKKNKQQALDEKNFIDKAEDHPANDRPSPSSPKDTNRGTKRFSTFGLDGPRKKNNHIYNVTNE